LRCCQGARTVLVRCRPGVVSFADVSADSRLANPPKIPEKTGFQLEARVGIEPTNAAFAEPCLTTWLPRREAAQPYSTTAVRQAPNITASQTCRGTNDYTAQATDDEPKKQETILFFASLRSSSTRTCAGNKTFRDRITVRLQVALTGVRGRFQRFGPSQALRCRSCL